MSGIYNLQNQFIIKAVRSSGKGGQHVNKVSTRVEVYFNISESTLLSEEQKELLQMQLQSRISKSGFIKVVCDTSRSQIKNKAEAVDRMLALIEKNLIKKKPRKKTKKSQTSEIERLQTKKLLSDKKSMRRKPGTSD